MAGIHFPGGSGVGAVNLSRAQNPERLSITRPGKNSNLEDVLRLAWSVPRIYPLLGKF
jgi:hypothetical protein